MGGWGARPNDDRQKHELRFTARHMLSSPVVSFPRGRHKSKQRLNSRSAKKNELLLLPSFFFPLFIIRFLPVYVPLDLLSIPFIILVLIIFWVGGGRFSFFLLFSI
jgi:hypothetical protein